MSRLKLYKSPYKILTLLIVVGVLFVVIDGLGVLEPVKKPLQKITVPIQLTVFQIKWNVSNVVSTIGEIGTLRSQNSQYAQENAYLLAEAEKLKKLEEENKTLREQLGVASVKDQDLMVAKVIGKSPIVSKKLLLIDKGKINGMKKGMIVVVKNILIGQIYDVSPRISSVQLVSDPDNKIPAITSKKVRGVVIGQFGAEIELKNVVQGDVLTEGDLVLTTGEGDYPAGLVIGKIEEIKKVEKELFQKAVVSPLIVPSDLTTIFVVGDK